MRRSQTGTENKQNLSSNLEMEDNNRQVDLDSAANFFASNSPQISTRNSQLPGNQEEMNESPNTSTRNSAAAPPPPPAAVAAEPAKKNANDNTTRTSQNNNSNSALKPTEDVDSAAKFFETMQTSNEEKKSSSNLRNRKATNFADQQQQPSGNNNNNNQPQQQQSASSKNTNSTPSAVPVSSNKNTTTTNNNQNQSNTNTNNKYQPIESVLSNDDGYDPRQSTLSNPHGGAGLSDNDHEALLGCCHHPSSCYESLVCFPCQVQRQLSVLVPESPLSSNACWLCYGVAWFFVVPALRFEVAARLYGPEHQRTSGCCGDFLAGALCPVLSLAQTHRQLAYLGTPPTGWFTALEPYHNYGLGMVQRME
jgi:hypothetical protein